jgi:hypothetical protein
MNWITDRSAEEGKRNAAVGRARVLAPVWSLYENRWDFLDGSAWEAPVLLPRQYRDLAQNSQVGLPPRHPWRSGLPDW